MRRTADGQQTRPGVRSAAQRVAGGAPRPDRLRRPGRSSSRRLCCREAAPSILAAMTTRVRRRRADRLWRPDLQLVEVNGARRGALPGGDARHMLLQDSLLGALAVQVIWGLCWAASRTLGTLDQR